MLESDIIWHWSCLLLRQDEDEGWAGLFVHVQKEFVSTWPHKTNPDVMKATKQEKMSCPGKAKWPSYVIVAFIPLWGGVWTCNQIDDGSFCRAYLPLLFDNGH